MPTTTYLPTTSGGSGYMKDSRGNIIELAPTKPAYQPVPPVAVTPAPQQETYDPYAPMPFEDTGPIQDFSQGTDPILYEQNMKEQQKGFYDVFAREYHKQNFNNLKDYENWVNKLPYANNPALKGHINELALKYMPKKLKMQYASQEADMQSAIKSSQLFNQQMKMAEQLRRMQTEGTIPKNYYLDQGKIKYNTRMLPSSGDPLKLKLIQFRAAQNDVKNAVAMVDQKAADKAQLKADLLLEEIMGMAESPESGQQSAQVNPNIIDTGGEDLQELIGAIEYANANPNDARAQAIGQDASERLQALQQ